MYLSVESIKGLKVMDKKSASTGINLLIVAIFVDPFLENLLPIY